MHVLVRDKMWRIILESHSSPITIEISSVYTEIKAKLAQVRYPLKEGHDLDIKMGEFHLSI